MFCKNCGKEINDQAVVCPHCGCSVKKVERYNPDDTGSIGWGVLGFLIPIIGLILYLVWRDNRPNDARVAGKGALISVIISIVIAILGVILISCTTCALLTRL